MVDAVPRAPLASFASGLLRLPWQCCPRPERSEGQRETKMMSERKLITAAEGPACPTKASSGPISYFGGSDSELRNPFKYRVSNCSWVGSSLALRLILR